MHDGWIDSAAHYAGWRQVQSGIEHLWQLFTQLTYGCGPAYASIGTSCQACLQRAIHFYFLPFTMHDGWIDSAAHYAGWRQVQSGIEHLWQLFTQLTYGCGPAYASIGTSCQACLQRAIHFYFLPFTMHDGWIDSAAHYAGWRQVQSGIEHLWQLFTQLTYGCGPAYASIGTSCQACLQRAIHFYFLPFTMHDGWIDSAARYAGWRQVQSGIEHLWQLFKQLTYGCGPAYASIGTSCQACLQRAIHFYFLPFTMHDGWIDSAAHYAGWR